MASKREPWPLLYGGWNSYREWADNGFLPKEAGQDDPKQDGGEEGAGRKDAGKGGGKRRGRHTGSGGRGRPEEPAAQERAPALPPAPPHPARPQPVHPHAAAPPPSAARASSGYFASPAPAEGPPPDPYAARAGSPARPYVRPPEPAEPPPAALRPYVMTSGRTRPRRDLPIEALVSTTAHGHAAASGQLPEHRAICVLCRSTLSVAEVAASLDVPLGVARVLIDDLAHQGLVAVHGVHEGGVSHQLLSRVLDGLRRL